MSDSSGSTLRLFPCVCSIEPLLHAPTEHRAVAFGAITPTHASLTAGTSSFTKIRPTAALAVAFAAAVTVATAGFATTSAAADRSHLAPLEPHARVVGPLAPDFPVTQPLRMTAGPRTSACSLVCLRERVRAELRPLGSSHEHLLRLVMALELLSAERVARGHGDGARALSLLDQLDDALRIRLLHQKLRITTRGLDHRDTAHVPDGDGVLGVLA